VERGRGTPSDAGAPSASPAPPLELASLREALIRLGVGPGDLLFVHSSWDGMANLAAGPTDVLAMLRELIGEEGTLAMPSNPILVEREGGRVYDVHRSPSKYGLLTEVFRRTRGVERSPIPLSTVCAIGPLAGHLTRDYLRQEVNTAYGEGSPYLELGRQGGKVLVLGVAVVRTLTLMHCAFDVLGEEACPLPDFFARDALTVEREGGTETVQVRWQLAGNYDDYLATEAFTRLMMASGTCRPLGLPGMKGGLVDARAFLDWHLPLARRYGLPYWGFPRG